MKRRSFLKSLCAALVSTSVALKLGASKPCSEWQFAGMRGDGAPKFYDPFPARFTYDERMGWERVPQFIQDFDPTLLPGWEKWIKNPQWETASFEYRADWPVGGVPQPRDRAVANPYAGFIIA